jgi:segregation and condensation protein A
MDATADPQAGGDRPTANATASNAPETEEQEREQETSPLLALDGFSGPLDHLLMLARAQTIDLAGISLTTLTDQLAAALCQAPMVTSLGQKAGWVVMAAWLVQLRSRLLLPVDAPAQQQAAAEADQLRSRLGTLQTTQALAGWLEQRPQLGRDVFVRGQPEIFGHSTEVGQAIDVIEFLWASLALFDDEAPADRAMTYQPAPLRLHTVAQARERILRRLKEQPDGITLDQLLPDEPPDGGEPARRARLRRSGWAATLVASLELAKQGEVVLGQGDDFKPIHVAPA